MTSSSHWDSVYARKSADAVSWFRPHLERSLALIEAARLAPDAPILDVGGGASTLVDDLLALGHTDITVLDVSEAAIEAAKLRLGDRAPQVTWIVADITVAELPERRYAFWHDRAVFHFLRDEEARRLYVSAVRRALRPDGHVVVATFGPDGPEKCSGLDVVRYDPDGLHAEFGSTFRKVSSETEVHVTPWGSEQQFVYCYCRMG